MSAKSPKLVELNCYHNNVFLLYFCCTIWILNIDPIYSAILNTIYNVYLNYNYFIKNIKWNGLCKTLWSEMKDGKDQKWLSRMRRKIMSRRIWKQLMQTERIPCPVDFFRRRRRRLNGFGKNLLWSNLLLTSLSVLKIQSWMLVSFSVQVCDNLLLEFTIARSWFYLKYLKWDYNSNFQFAILFLSKL